MDLVNWETALPSRLKITLPADTQEVLANARKTYHRFGKFFDAIQKIRFRLEREPLERTELDLICGELRIPADFDIAQISWKPDYDSFYYNQLRKRTRKMFLFRDEYIFELERATVVEVPQQGHATYVFSRPPNLDQWVRAYASAKDDIRQNRGNAAEQLGFLGRVMHGRNPRNWVRDLRAKIGEPVDYSLAVERRLTGSHAPRRSIHFCFRDRHLVLLQESVAPESQRLSILAQGRARGRNPISQVPQSGPASGPPAAGGSENCHARLRSDRHSAWDRPLMDPMTIAFAALGMVFLVALLMWTRARQQIRQSGIPDGRVVYQDTDRRHNVERPLVSPSYGLTGKPDYLVETANGVIPVELKSRNCPRSGPHEGDVAQVTAYCVLVEDAFGATPPRGIIQYADRSWPIRYTQKDRKRILQISTKCARPETPGRCTAIISTRLVAAPAATEPFATRHSTEWHGVSTIAGCRSNSGAV